MADLKKALTESGRLLTSRTSSLFNGDSMITRRDFLDTMAVGAAALAAGSTAKSYAQIMGANERLNFASSD